MKKLYTTILLVVLLASIVWIPIIMYFMHSSIPPPREKWMTTQGIVLDNGTTPIFNAIVVYAQGYYTVYQNVTVPTNMTLVKSDSWGYVNFRVKMVSVLTYGGG